MNATPRRWTGGARDCPVFIAITCCRCRLFHDPFRLKGSTTFTDNSAFPEGAAIFNDIQDDDPAVTTTTYPSDTVFEGNEADVRRFLLDVRNVFIELSL